MWASRKSARIAEQLSKRIRHHANLRSLLVPPGARHTSASGISKQPRSSASRTARIFLVLHIVLTGRDGSNQTGCGLALFYFSALSRIAHIGIVTKVEEWGVYTVEGNTSPEPSDELSVERDGDGLYAKKRNWHEFGKFGGFGFVNF